MIIYKATNKITNKIYIGQTTKTLDERICTHKKCSLKMNTKFYNALRSYGFDNFMWEIIETVSSKKELDEKEMYYIQKYDSVQNGYNMTNGGTGGYNQSAVDVNRILRKGKKYDDIYSSKEIAERQREVSRKTAITLNEKWGFDKIDKELQRKYASMGNKARSNNGYTHSSATREKISIAQKGITYDERYGKDAASQLKNKISIATKTAMKNVDKELLGKKSLDARRPGLETRHREQRKLILELLDKKMPVKHIIAELNISVPTYYQRLKELKNEKSTLVK